MHCSLPTITITTRQMFQNRGASLHEVDDMYACIVNIMHAKVMLCLF